MPHGWQSLALALPTASENVPAAHERQKLLPEFFSAYLPTPQRRQMVDAGLVETLPGPQGMQLETLKAPTVSEAVPAAHNKHVELPKSKAAYLPAKHFMHVDELEAPSAAEDVPDPHFAHEVAAVSSEKDPAAQETHAVLPGLLPLDAYLPAGHARHAALVFAPMAAEKNPAGHNKQTVALLMLEYVPAGQ